MERESQAIAVTEPIQPPIQASADTATEPTDWAEQFKKLGAVGPLAVVSITLPAIGAFTLLSTLNHVGPWLKSHDASGVMIYVLGFTLLSGCALLATWPQAILGGWAFGFAAGFPAALTGLSGGACVGYVIARLISKQKALHLIDEHPKWRAIYDALVGRSFLQTLFIVTLLRLPPNSPFSLTNLVMAATRVNPLAFIMGTAFGMAPRTLMVVWLSAQTPTLSFRDSGKLWSWVASLVLTVVLVGVIGLLAKRALARVTYGNQDPSKLVG